MKHAYLIMAHNEFELLEKLLILLDDKRNDIYLHIDKKVKNFDFDRYSSLVKKAKLFYTKRMDVKWGSVSQIKCTLLLLNESTKVKHSYYHFISGVDLPLKNQNYIHDFFDKSGKDFISFDNYDLIDDFYLNRVKYYHLCQNNWRNKHKFVARVANAIRFRTFKLEKKLKINRLKKSNIEFRKGANWFSITEKTAKYLLNQKNILKYFKYSYCADELFVQTIIYNSKLKDNLYFDKNNKPSDMRYVDWNKGNPAILKMEDYESMMNSDMVFARKFSLKTDQEVINKIYNELRK